MFGNSLIRGLFLLFIFPKFISTGRKWFNGHSEESNNSRTSNKHDREIPTSPQEFPASPGDEVAQEPVTIPEVDEEEEDGGTGFDLLFVRWSLVVDSVVTAIAGLSRQGWQVYAGKSIRCQMARQFG